MVERMPHVKAATLVEDVGAFLEQSQRRELARPAADDNSPDNSTRPMERSLMEDAVTW